MIAMDQINHIRTLYREQGMNLSEISRVTGHDWRTVQKYVDMDDFNPPRPKPGGDQPNCPKLGPYKQLIDTWLLEDKKAPRKQRHTAVRVYTRLCKETEGFDCSYRLVAEYVAARRKQMHLDNSDKGKLPLVHRPGEAQGDFGAADFYENGRRHSGKYFVVSFPYSNQGYHQLNYGENMECLLEALDAIFRHIGGVPTEIWFDNTSTIVSKVIKSGGRVITDKFSRFMEHYGFKAKFCNPESGWEKGNVEAKVGYSRRNFLVPMPRFSDLASFNRLLLEEDDADGNRPHYSKDMDISELFEADKLALLPYPKVPFELSGFIAGVKTDGWGKFTLNNGKHSYSTSPSHTNAVINLRLTSRTVTALDENMREIVTHRRLYGDDHRESMEWLPYLSYISSHPRSLRNTGIYEMMPGEMQVYMDSCPDTDKGKVLKVLAELTKRSGFSSAVNTVNQAIQHQASDADSLLTLYNRLYSDIPQLPPMDLNGAVPEMGQMPANLIEFDRFLKKGGAAHG